MTNNEERITKAIGIEVDRTTDRILAARFRCAKESKSFRYAVRDELLSMLSRIQNIPPDEAGT
jgi:hypothetical protein